jgi:hypothetical protein
MVSNLDTIYEDMKGTSRGSQYRSDDIVTKKGCLTLHILAVCLIDQEAMNC